MSGNTGLTDNSTEERSRPPSVTPYPYIAFRDRPCCPYCRVNDEVQSGGQWWDGVCLWACVKCDVTWKTHRADPSANAPEESR